MRLIMLLCGIAVAACALAVPPAGVTLPLVIWDVNFNQDTVGQAPHPMTKAQWEAAGQDDWKRVPLRTYDTLEYVTRTRIARVEEAACGFTDQPLVFTVTDNDQPHWGPRMRLSVPPAIAVTGKRFHLTFDVAMATVAKMGGVLLWDVVDLKFFEDGSVKAGGTEVGRYKTNTPLHVDAVIDAVAKTVTLTLDGKAAQAVTLPWAQPKQANFTSLALNGLLPGGHNYVGRLAFDNIKLVLEEAR